MSQEADLQRDRKTPNTQDKTMTEMGAEKTTGS